MDESFLPLHEALPALLPLSAPVGDKSTGRVTIVACEVETPIELDVSVAEGRVVLGGVPPLYHLETSVQPSLHHVRVRVVSEASDG